jgi:ectoine hydroxylase-related dioxygenase (phytanoyl-CoA dioxygenase family)
VDVEVDAGDVVFFHDLAVHASRQNASGSDRWSLIATYRHAARPDESTVWSKSLPLTLSGGQRPCQNGWKPLVQARRAIQNRHSSEKSRTSADSEARSERRWVSTSSKPVSARSSRTSD